MKSLPITTNIKILMKIPYLLYLWLLYSTSKNKAIINSDIEAWALYRDYIDVHHLNYSLLRLLALQPEFVSQFKMRLGFMGHFVTGGGKLRVASYRKYRARICIHAWYWYRVQLCCTIGESLYGTS